MSSIINFLFYNLFDIAKILKNIKLEKKDCESAILAEIRRKADSQFDESDEMTK